MLQQAEWNLIGQNTKKSWLQVLKSRRENFLVPASLVFVSPKATVQRPSSTAFFTTFHKTKNFTETVFSKVRSNASYMPPVKRFYQRS
jgi:hypothetical protein